MNPATDPDWRGSVTREYNPETGRYELVIRHPSLSAREIEARADDDAEQWDPPGTKRAEPKEPGDPPTAEDRARDRERRRQELAKNPRTVTNVPYNVARTVQKAIKAVPGAPKAVDKPVPVAEPFSKTVMGVAVIGTSAYKALQDRRQARTARENAGRVEAKTLRDARSAARRVDTAAVNRAVEHASWAKKQLADANANAQQAYRAMQAARDTAKKVPTPDNIAKARWAKLQYEGALRTVDRTRKASTRADDAAYKLGQRYVTSQGLSAKERAHQARRAADAAEKQYRAADARAQRLQAAATRARLNGSRNADAARRAAGEARTAARTALRNSNAAKATADDAELAVRNINNRTRQSLDTRRTKADTRNGLTPDTDESGKATRRPDGDPGDAGTPARRPQGPKGGTDNTGKTVTPAGPTADRTTSTTSKDGKGGRTTTTSRSGRDGQSVKTGTRGSTPAATPTRSVDPGRARAIEKQQALDARDAKQLRPSVKAPAGRSDSSRTGSKARVRGGPRGGVGAEIISWIIFEHAFPEHYAKYEQQIAKRDQKLLDETRRALQDPNRRKEMLKAYEWTKKNRPEVLDLMGPPSTVDERNRMFDEALREDRRNGPQTVRTEEQEHGNRRPVVTVRTEEQEHGNRRPKATTGRKPVDPTLARDRQDSLDMSTVRTERQEHGNRLTPEAKERIDASNRDAMIADKKKSSTPVATQRPAASTKKSTVRTEEQEHGNRRPKSTTGKKPVDPTLARDKQDSKKTSTKKSTVRTEEQEHGNRRPKSTTGKKPVDPTLARDKQDSKKTSTKKSTKSSDPAGEAKRKAALKKQDMPA